MQDASSENVIALARQPIFDARQSLWGYEVCCVNAVGGLCPTPESESASLACIASNAYIGLQQVSDRGKRILVAFGQRAVLEKIPYALPPSLGVVKVAEKTGIQAQVLDSLVKMKEEGYLILVSDFSGSRELEPLYRIADAVSLHFAGFDEPLFIERVLKAGSIKGLKLLATGILSRDVMTRVAALGFELFQGSYFKSPEEIPVRRIASNEIARFRLISLIEAAEPDLEKVAEAIQADATLTFRLLTYLNSASFELRNRIRSVRQAITLLGWPKTRNWLRVALLSDLAQGPGSAELVYLSAQRGHFLELLGGAFDFWGFEPDSLQLLGLFSLLDVMISMPMEEALQYLPLDDHLKAALTRGVENEYSPLLRLSEALEEGRWEDSDRLVRRLGLDSIKVKEAFQNAVQWANQFGSIQPSAVP